MRVVLALAGLCLGVSAIAGWTLYPFPKGVVLWLPPGSQVYRWEGVWRVDLPVDEGTTLLEFVLLVEEGNGPPPGAVPVSFGGKVFYFSSSVEGAAGSQYESLRYELGIPGRGWITLTFVIRTVNPGVFDVPPPPYNRDAIMGLIQKVLGKLELISLPLPGRSEIR